jgi:tetratricopeptide (TPR) repeat protein
MNDTEIIKEIDRYINGELSGKEIDELWIRFLKNPEYYRWFETDLHLRKLAADAQEIRIARETDAGAGKQHIRKIPAWTYATAAILIMCLGLSLFLLQDRNSIYTLAIDRIDYTELAGADIFRSDDTEAQRMDVMINQGLAYAYNGEERRAIDLFEELLAQNPGGLHEARIRMNLGILNYNTRSFNRSAAHLSAAAENSYATEFFREKAWWFLGNAYLNLREFDSAKNAFTAVAGFDGRYADEALTILEQLADLE